MDNTSLAIRDFSAADTDDVVKLWQDCGLTRPWNNPHQDVARKLTDKNGAFWVGLVDDQIVASIMIGYDGHRGSINYLAVSPKHQRDGFGALIMARAEEFLVEIGCPKVSFCVRKDNLSVLSFYDGLGYNIDDVHLLGKRLIPDD
ncbi:GNAT family acetyltransferase [Alphaproteobacteria bacterium]|jgi:ribosomal protein S18 acetylase RimI-like enzyme|nr:GNAT family acetyltransferase [Alphaproteobacteria bacterium]